jgi:two-component system chemotaxis response regulator CheY
MSKKTVMVVDDEQDIVDAISTILEDTGRYETVKASNGKQAFDLFQDLSPDLVITDVHMANANGLWLVNKIREIDEFKPIVLMSSAVAKSSEEFSSKYQLFIQKPEDIKNILSVVDDFLDLEVV